ncbi:hypothetical protein [Flagellimonas meridianipacifica]|uniref:Uncharacterized protein n=1 Tax=Flagellimonas meridianipacifica TaxID=1080225 RepID=A0A2T0M9Z8_9FLAO|nr:hypothetical protein [Allomuricauda pacifica]PRX54331.1 hypothetical protein CLV81_2731 [Allomuricauda pacifica]
MTFSKNHRILITLVVTALALTHILWDHFNGGIPTHYLLHDKNLPGIPNWLGALALPFFTWFLLYRIAKRVNSSDSKENLKLVVLRFLAALIVSIIIAFCFTFTIDIIDYIMLIIFALAFIFPLYKSEFLLGWVLGSAFTFGAAIPMGFGSLFALVCFVFYLIGRFIKKLLGIKV